MRRAKMAKNLMGKTRPKDNPYMIFEGGPFGDTLVLKSWQGDDTKPFGRWFVAVNGDMGDSYVGDIVAYGRVKYIDPMLVEAGYSPPGPADVPPLDF
jgi:hypothetical protein